MDLYLMSGTSAFSDQHWTEPPPQQRGSALLGSQQAPPPLQQQLQQQQIPVRQAQAAAIDNPQAVGSAALKSGPPNTLDHVAVGTF
ncbi:hypothetical protein Pelo_16769 [Pelomyxa schiedti]|nr:hypothetical protein Pelo_16769 [Pelomyxa schiedti]